MNDMNRYEQICVCPYQLIFLHFIWSDFMRYGFFAINICACLCICVHICAYLCIIYVHFCAYLCISDSTQIWLSKQLNGKCNAQCMQFEGFVFTELHCAKCFCLVKQQRWHGLWARSWPRSCCKRGFCLYPIYVYICPYLCICLYLQICLR